VCWQLPKVACFGLWTETMHDSENKHICRKKSTAVITVVIIIIIIIIFYFGEEQEQSLSRLNTSGKTSKFCTSTFVIVDLYIKKKKNHTEFVGMFLPSYQI
jgi:Mn2+/Fe2+ NRAMP family transporter